MSACDEVTKIQSFNHHPDWLDSVPKEHQSLFSHLIPCIAAHPTEHDRHAYREVCLSPSQSVYIHLHSLKLLGIKKKAFDAIQDTSQRYTFLASRLPDLTEQQHTMLSTFKDIMESFCEPVERELNKRLLVEITRRAIEQLETSQNKEVKFQLKDGIVIHALKDETGKLVAISAPEKKHLLGSGAFSKTYKVTLFTSGAKCHALKSIITENDPRKTQASRQHILNNTRIASLIYADTESSSLTGLISRKFVVFNTLGSLMEIYEGSLNSFMKSPGKYPVDYANITFKERLAALKDLFLGLEHLQTKNILHGDIKLSNVLFKFDHGKLHLHLSDFGGSETCESVNIKMRGFLGTTFSPAYLSKTDADRMMYATIFNSREVWIEVHRARDVLALGLTAFEFLTDSRLYQLPIEPGQLRDYTNLSLFTENFLENSFKDQGDKVVNLFLQLLHNNYLERPTPAKVVEIINDILI